MSTYEFLEKMDKTKGRIIKKDEDEGVIRFTSHI